jgi:hypothetical protein
MIAESVHSMSAASKPPVLCRHWGVGSVPQQWPPSQSIGSHLVDNDAFTGDGLLLQCGQQPPALCNTQLRGYGGDDELSLAGIPEQRLDLTNANCRDACTEAYACTLSRGT